VNRDDSFFSVGVALLHPRKKWAIAIAAMMGVTAVQHSTSPSAIAAWILVFLIGQVAYNLGVDHGERLPALHERCFKCNAFVQGKDGSPTIGRPLCTSCNG
jgi:hypothetical protein